MSSAVGQVVAPRHVQVHDTDYRQPLDPLLLEAFTKDVAAGPEFDLTFPLHIGEDKWGQVWNAKIRYEGREADVAIKIYVCSKPVPLAGKSRGR